MKTRIKKIQNRNYTQAFGDKDSTVKCQWCDYSFSQSLWYISRIILNICKTLSAFLETIRTNSTTQWITCKSL